MERGQSGSTVIRSVVSSSVLSVSVYVSTVLFLSISTSELEQSQPLLVLGRFGCFAVLRHSTRVHEELVGDTNMHSSVDGDTCSYSIQTHSVTLA